MRYSKKLLTLGLITATGLGAMAASIATADPAKDAAAGTAPPVEMKLPPGWTMEDMQACMAAGTPGKMQAFLAAGAGEWQGSNTMWMMPDSEPMKTECSTTVSTMMDGRYTKVEMKGEMPGMGPYQGMGLYGFDNVKQTFVATWLDNHSTGIMIGTGQLSPDGKTLTWSYSYTCPVTKKPTVMREIETITGPNSKTLEMWGTEPKSGKEYKMMRLELMRKS